MDPTIVAIVTAGISGVLGVIVAEAFSHFREKRRRESEAKEHDLERRHQLRREVYLAAADAITEFSSSLGRMVMPSYSEEEGMRVSQRLNSAIARINLVAGPSTIRSVVQLHRKLVVVNVELTAARQPIAIRQHAIAHMEQIINVFHQETQRFIEMLRASNIEGRGRDDRYLMIEKQAEFASENHRKAAEELEKLHAAQQADQMAFFEQLAPRLQSSLGHQIQALLAIRSELGSDNAADVVRQELEENERTFNELLTKAFSEIRNQNVSSIKNPA